MQPCSSCQIPGLTDSVYATVSAAAPSHGTGWFSGPLRSYGTLFSVKVPRAMRLIAALADEAYKSVHSELVLL